MAKRTNLKVVAMAVLVILVGGSVWADLTDGLIAHWTFDEGSGSTAYDSAGSNNGTINGALWTTGQIGDALDFDGSNDFISVPASPALDFSHSYTISAWLKPTENPSHAMVWFGYHGGVPYGSNTKRVIVLRMYPNGSIRFGLYNDDLNTTAGMVTFGEWNHVVISYDYGTDTSAIYVNSQLKASGNNGPYYGGLRTATIGKWDVTFQSQENFDGLMDEFMVYNRALLAEEVEQLYQLELPELLGIEIVGPDQTAESFPTPYKAIAHYDDDSIKDVTNSADWSVVPEDMASIAAGLLTAEKINLPGETITMTTQYTEGENTLLAQKDVEILMICPGGICTPEEIVQRNLSNVMNRKLSILEQLYETIAQEEALLDYMNETFKKRDFGNTRKRDVVRAKKKIHSAIKLEDVAEILIDRSLDKLDDAMNILGIEPDSQE